MMRPRILLAGCLALIISPHGAAGQGPAEDATGQPAYCVGLVDGRKELLPLLPVCEFAVSLRHNLPNFVCRQTMTRFSWSPAGYLRSKDVVQATVTYEDGRESYSQVTVNGRPTEHGIPAVSDGAVTFGEFGSLLSGIFSEESKAGFTPRAQEHAGSGAARVFDFRIAKENNHWWVLRESGKELYPELRGSMSVDGSTSRLLALRVEAADIARDFPVTSAGVSIRYGEVAISELGTFLLPLSAEWTSCLRPIAWRRGSHPSQVSRERPPCIRNEITFSDYRKFASKVRIVVDPD